MTQDSITLPQGLAGPRGRRLWLPRVLSGALGVILLTAAVLKAADMALFVRQMGAYGIISQHTLLVLSAWGVIALECALGVGLVVAYRPRFILTLTAVLFLTFMGATTWAWLRGSADQCGCFGDWLSHSPGEAALGNLILLAGTLWAWVWSRDAKNQRARGRAWATGMACLIGVALPVAFGFPISTVIQSPPETVRGELGRLELQGGDVIDLTQGDHLVIVMGTDCGHCQEAVPALNMLTGVPDLPPLIAVCQNTASDRMRFIDAFQPLFQVDEISENDFWRLLADGEMPRTILVRDGRTIQVWDQIIPDEDTVRAALAVSE
jgi:hypothetical protein